MLVFDPTSGRDDPAFEKTLTRLKALVADMKAVRQGQAAHCFRDDAPRLDNWALAARPAACLIGNSTGHPVLSGKEVPTVTSGLWLLSADGEWARTLSRWYRLGTPRPMEGQSK